MLLDHLGIRVSDMKRARTFYGQVLRPLNTGELRFFESEDKSQIFAIGYGKQPGSGDPEAGKPSFWLGPHQGTISPTHVCFSAATTAEVDAFYAAAIAAGGKDNGPPGLRAMYHPGYYGAFVLDPDGHNIEACCHQGAAK